MKKGQKTKVRQTLFDKAEELGVDPFEILLLFAKGDWEALGYKKETWYKPVGNDNGYDALYITPELRGKCAAEACAYLLPKLKAIEHTGKDGGPIQAEVRQVSEMEITNPEVFEHLIAAEKAMRGDK